MGSADVLDWRWIATLDSSIGEVRAVGTDRFADTTWVGTATGRAFLIDNSTGDTNEIAIEKPKTGLGVIGRIVSWDPGAAAAVMETGGGGVVLEMKDGAGFQILRGSRPPPFERFYALDYNPYGSLEGIDLAVATDTSVFLRKADDGTWFASDCGLPQVPHCSDLRFARWNDRTVLFLSTFGRSVWMRTIPDVVK